MEGSARVLVRSNIPSMAQSVSRFCYEEGTSRLFGAVRALFCVDVSFGMPIGL